jgi:hypothetical protein
MADIEVGIKTETILITRPPPILAILEIQAKERAEDNYLKKLTFS